MRDLVNSLRSDIESGTSFSEALGKHPVQFDELFRNLVKAGESAGVLDTVLETIATYKENIEALKGKIKKAMFYPAMVVAVARAIRIARLERQAIDMRGLQGAAAEAEIYRDADAILTPGAAGMSPLR